MKQIKLNDIDYYIIRTIEDFNNSLKHYLDNIRYRPYSKNFTEFIGEGLYEFSLDQIYDDEDNEVLNDYHMLDLELNQYYVPIDDILAILYKDLDNIKTLINKLTDYHSE